jgi:UDP-glucose 4-epimerase
MQKILVTGGTGFIGSHTVVELAREGYHPIIIDNFSNSHRDALIGIQNLVGRDIPFHEVDCTDKVQVQEVIEEHGGVDGVIHFAAYKAVGESVRYPSKYYHNNIGSLVAVVEAMQATNVQNLVFSSSCTVYGQPDSLPVTENSPFAKANSPYGYTKQVCERILTDQAGAKDNQLSSILLRYFNPIGAHPSGKIGELPLGQPENLIPYVTQTAIGERDTLTVFGNDYDTSDGTCVRDYIHVVDLAKAHVKALVWLDERDGCCEAFNLGTGQGKTVLDVINSFEEVSGEKLNYTLGPRRPGDVEKIYASADRAEQELNWKCELDLDDSLRDAWNWQKRLDAKKAVI